MPPDTLYKVYLDYQFFPEEITELSLFPVAGYMNKQGELIIPMEKYEACFSDEFIWFATVLTKGENSCICAVDRDGKVLFNVFWFDNWPDELSDGMIRIVSAEGKIGYADHTGRIIIEPAYSWAGAFVDGTASVTYSHTKEPIDDEHFSIKNDNWIMIDKTGKVIE